MSHWGAVTFRSDQEQLSPEWQFEPWNQSRERGREEEWEEVKMDIFTSVTALESVFISVRLKGLVVRRERGREWGVININSRADWRQHSSEVAHDDVSWATPTHRLPPPVERGEERRRQGRRGCWEWHFADDVLSPPSAHLRFCHHVANLHRQYCSPS